MFNRINFWGKGFYYLVLLCVLFTTFTKSADGATGINHTINFQGKLANNDGTNVSNGSYSIVFSLYTVSSGGSAAWTETDSVITTDGVFRVSLGAGTTFSSAGIDFNSDTYYLGIKVGSDAEMTPRVQFTAVPYAFNAEKVNGLIVTNTTGTLTIPNSTTISFGGAFTTSGSSGLTLTTSGTTNATLPSGTITLVDLSSSQTLTNKIIGSTGLIFSGATTDITTGTNEDFTISSNGTGKIGLFTTGALLASLDLRANSGTLAVASVSGATSFASLVVDNGGAGDLFTASAGGVPKFTISNTGILTVGGGQTSDITTQGGNNLSINNGGAGAMNIGTVNTTTMTLGRGGQILNLNSPTIQVGNGTTTNIQNTGNGGITILPSGTGVVTLGINTGTGNIRVSPNAGGQAALIVNDQGSGDIFTASASGATRFTISNAGSVGVGTNTPLGTFDVRANLGTISIASVSGKTSFAGLTVDNSGVGDIFTASSSGLTRMRITNNGSILLQGDVIASIGNGASGNGSNAVANVIGDQGSLVPNAGFESGVASSGAMFADGWFGAATSSGSTVRDTTSAPAKGTASAKVTLNASRQTAFYSTCMPLALGNANLGAYNLMWYAIGSSTIPVVRAYLDGYTSKANCQSDSSATVPAPQATGTITTAWAKYGGLSAITNIAPNITWARVHFFVGCPAACTTGTTVNIDGVRLIESSLTGGVDYAENYPADPDNVPQPGDVVSMASLNGTTIVRPATTPMDQSVIGVVSTNPGQVLDDGSLSDPKVPIALSGRIPTKVSTKNGVIHIGDYLASSDIAGVAVKATFAGPVIGTAMEDDTDIDSTHIKPIVMFVKNTYYPGYTTFDATALLSGDKTKANHVEGLDVITSQLAHLSSKVASLSANFSVFGASTNETEATTNSVLPLNRNISLDGLTIMNDATISGKLRVKGSGLFEGVVSVIDTLKAHDFMATGIAEFFNSVLFHNDVSFEGRPTFNNDTAGSAIIKKGSNHVDITFDTVYDTIPIINATLTLTNISTMPTPGDDKTPEQQFLDKGYRYIVSKRSTKGFSIVLNTYADEDISFSWSVFSIKDPKTFQSGGGFLPTPSIMLSPEASNAAY